MGTYNTLLAEVACPRCGELVLAEVECRFGNSAQMETLRIGSQYPWVPNKQVQNGGRPDQGNVVGDGYMECPSCGKDAFLCVLVRGDIITGIEVDRSKPGMIPDAVDLE